MDKNYVIYNGIQVIAGWPEKIIAAQFVNTYLINDIVYQRVAYGHEEEDWGQIIGHVTIVPSSKVSSMYLAAMSSAARAVVVR